MDRSAVPAELKRAVLVEAGHRCAIPTCRATTTEIAHIVPWAESQEHSFENLIALCPNCHTRFDQKKEIDRQSVKMYKHNLGILNNRYGEFERRLFEILGKTNDRIFVLSMGGDLLVANAVKDGFFIDMNVESMNVNMSDGIGYSRNFSMILTYRVTDAGVEFIKSYSKGIDIA
jgi:HNH endonuclease